MHVIAYLAGYFDGEGTITAKRNDMALMLQVGSTDCRILDVFQAEFGGGITCDHRDAPNKDVYQWFATNRDSQLSVLHALGPHLVLKRQQAALALQFLALPTGRDMKRGARLQIMEQIFALNKKGK